MTAVNTHRPIDLSAPGALDELFAYHRSVFGDARMENEPAPPAPAEPTFTVPVPQAPALDTSNPAFVAALEQARKQERDKLYDTIEGLKAKVNGVDDLQQTVESLRAEQEAKVREAAEAAAREAEEKARKEWEEKGAKDLLADATAKWEQRFAEMQQQQEAEKAALAKEAEFHALSAQTQAMVSAAIENGEIAPELAPLVRGNNLEEISASLESVKAASEAVAASVAQTISAAPPAPRGVAPTGYAPVGPMDTSNSTRTLSADDIRNMTMADYAKIRGSLPGVNAGGNANRGLFG